MASSIALLPFWILGAPLVIAVINLLMLPKRGTSLHRDQPSHDTTGAANRPGI